MVCLQMMGGAYSTHVGVFNQKFLLNRGAYGYGVPADMLIAL